ncbi:uncharacterized protein LOC117110591 [Anneissia japonica]|uniref:uncharacterized protein LOC117110591 n=1 Tax=Anneissia japonica TaxID=1529436 RepID=UPI0014259F7B|nr:uncharacterized protein LOC117110591 [Anneissia japonica]XP_033109235.1 uncharacterized protein LOC117110591 [Anneissia japonica]XP_033109236.1 uncharacterized protein LOC117110591 [Anneissia japonica]
MADNTLVMDGIDDRLDSFPLLPLSTDLASFEELRKRQRTRGRDYIHTEVDNIIQEHGYQQYGDDVLKNSSSRRNRKIQLVIHDALLLILDFIQVYALIMAMSIRWTWPYDWLYVSRFAFFFNLDIWEFLKVNDESVFYSVRDSFIASSLISLDYRFLIFGWMVFVFVGIVIFISLYIYMNYQKNYNLLLRIATMQRTYIVLCEVIALPIGVTMAKLFHCSNDGNLDVHNETSCYSGEHFAYIIVSLTIAVNLYILLPIWMIAKIRTQLFSKKAERHEGYLQLKESEFSHSLDALWALNLYHIFSSFKRFWAYYRPVMMFMKFLLVIWYAIFLTELLVQISLVLTTILIIFIIMAIKRPFRVTSFNVYILCSFFSLTLLAFMGVMQNTDNNNAFFTPTYLYDELMAILGFWLGVTFLWIIYIVLRYTGVFCSRRPLWPQMTTRGMAKLSEDTQKYMRALLEGRIVLEHALLTNPLFSPAHEVSRQIQIINAYCREAELLNDPIHDALWDLLDELIEAHSKIAPVSLFAESVKASIRETSQELLKMMPEFKRRLAQREYDFILMTPMKRRMLLKMYVLGIFVNGHVDKSRAQHTDTVQKLYNPMESLVLKHRQVEGDDGFYDDFDGDQFELGPTSHRLNLKQQKTIQAIEVIDEEVEEVKFKRKRTNTFVSEMSSFIDDDADLAYMMYGIPSRPATTMDGSRSVHSRQSHISSKSRVTRRTQSQASISRHPISQLSYSTNEPLPAAPDPPNKTSVEEDVRSPSRTSTQADVAQLESSRVSVQENRPKSQASSNSQPPNS